MFNCNVKCACKLFKLFAAVFVTENCDVSQSEAVKASDLTGGNKNNNNVRKIGMNRGRNKNV